MNAAAAVTPEVRAAYEYCRQVARSRARNFYYAFLALPKPKRDAICAVYAFMRRADDIADEPSQPIVTRRAQMANWLANWKQVESGAATADPVFIALRDAQQRFSIPADWLLKLVEGTTLDLSEEPPVYQTFEDLYRYCYLVASVVGLVCIRIFGYHDSRAEKLAEETGIAFQLTNILRDVAEDAAMGRVYLPQQDLQQFGLTAQDLLNGSAVAGDRTSLQQLLVQEGQRADAYYASADALLPLIDADARPALWVLVKIYRSLLHRMQSRNYDVFSTKVALSSGEKYLILTQGLGKMGLQKIWPRSGEAAR
jgi:phytoene synthase